MPDLVPKQTLIKARTEGLALIESLRSRLKGFKIATPDDYSEGDLMLAEIQKAKKGWKVRIAEITDPLKVAMDSVKLLASDISKPYDEMEAQVKDEMKAFEVNRRRLEMEADRRKQAAIEKAQQEERERLAALEKARTKPMKDKIREQVATVQQKMSDLQAEPTNTAVKSAHSMVKTYKKWRVTDIRAVLIAVVNGELDIEMLEISSVTVTQLMRDAQPPAGPWLPGIEVYEEIDISGKGGARG